MCLFHGEQKISTFYTIFVDGYKSNSRLIKMKMMQNDTSVFFRIKFLTERIFCCAVKNSGEEVISIVHPNLQNDWSRSSVTHSSQCFELMKLIIVDVYWLSNDSCYSFFHNLVHFKFPLNLDKWPKYWGEEGLLICMD